MKTVDYKSVFTKYQKQFLKDNYQSMTAKDMAQSLGCKIYRVRMEMYTLGLFKQVNRYWTDQEIQILKSNYQEKGDKEIGIMLGRTLKMIEKKRSYLGLKRTAQQIKKIRSRNHVIFKHGYQKGTQPPHTRKEGEIYDRNCDPYIYIKHEGEIKRYTHVVWEKHNGKIPDDKVVFHLNGNPKDDRIENLRLITRSELAMQNAVIHKLPDEYRKLFWNIIKLNRKVKNSKDVIRNDKG